MKFIRQSFMGIELDVLVGHPEHEMLFVATQVARAAALTNPSQRAHLQAWKVGHGLAITVECLKELETLKKPKGVQKTSWLFSESAVYQMLLRGHSPASEPFHKWVSEEVLPTVRKTVSYNAEDSQPPIAVAIMDRLKYLEGIILKQGENLELLRQELRAKTSSLEAPVAAAKPIRSPYSKKEIFFTPVGTVEPYSYIAKPDFGLGPFASKRGKYKINLTIASDKAQPLIDKILKLHEADYAKRLAEHKKNPPQVQRGRKPLLPYQGVLPFIENEDGTVTFKFAGWASYEKDGELVLRPLRIVDTTGELIVDASDIAPGSEGKVRFTIVPYGWNATLGASVKLQLEGFMLTTLVELDDGQHDWIGQEEEVAQW